MIEILKSGPANCIHDAGRLHLLHIGVSRSGAMDRLSFAIANALLGNPPEAATVEVAMFPFTLRIETDTAIAVTGADAAAELDGRRLPPNWAIPAKAGAELRLSPPARGQRSYVAFAGGIDVPMVLGSRSTDLKSGFGGVEGRGLKKGDRLALAPAQPPRLPAAGLGAAPDEGVLRDWAAFATGATVRVIPAAEFPEFTEESRRAFFETGWTVSHQADRMGYRLEGPELSRNKPRELFSHGLLPGTVQVPASGQPIIQLADANTCGGYPKIAVVIAPDLWKIAQTGPGASLRFVETTRTEALAAQRTQEEMLSRLRATFAAL